MSHPEFCFKPKFGMLFFKQSVEVANGCRYLKENLSSVRQSRPKSSRCSAPNHSVLFFTSTGLV